VFEVRYVRKHDGVFIGRNKPMTKQPGLDNRHRDKNGEIHSKMGNTLVSTLRRTYGDNFAKGWRSDKKLENLLDDTGAKSLTDFQKNYD
jgi:hypothetical protein